MGNDIRSLQKQVADLKRRVDQRPVLLSKKAAAPYRTVLIDGGNTLEEGSNGINYEATVASVPSAYDPDVASSFIDGIGRGRLYVNGVVQDGYVLVVNSDAGTFRNALIENDVVYSGGPISIPVAGGGTVTAYTCG